MREACDQLNAHGLYRLPASFDIRKYDRMEEFIDFLPEPSRGRLVRCEPAAIYSATDEELAKLRQTAKDPGASTAFSASEIAASMENLASAGFESYLYI